MDNHTLANIVLARGMQRCPSLRTKINSKIQFRSEMEVGDSRMIKITQFNSSLFVSDERLTHKTYKTSHSTSPQKQFNIKRVSESKNKAIANAQKIIEIELKRKEKPPARQKYSEDIATSAEVQKLLLASKWSLKSDASNFDLATSTHSTQTVVVLKAHERRPESEKSLTPLQLSDNILFGKPKDLQPKQSGKVSSSKEKSRAKVGGEQVFIASLDSEQFSRKFSASPRKGYSRHFEQQKRYQQNIQREKREMLEVKRELNKNYTKPFNPPENVTAFAYIVYEADAKRSGKLRKFSARRRDEELNEIRKIFLHSHQVVVSLNSRTAVEIASLTKIMTCIVALDLSRKYDLLLAQEMVTIGLFEQNIGGTSANVKKGEIYSIEQLLHGLMLPSGNDASLAIAVWGGKLLLDREGGKHDNEASPLSTLANIQGKVRARVKKRDYYERFVQEMNLKAGELNMEKTKYCNSHGLSSPENRSCAFDLAILSEYAMNNSDFRRIVSCKAYETEIQIKSAQAKELQAGKESRKLIKKRSGVSVNQEGLMELEEMKDMDEVCEDRFSEEEEPPNEEDREIESRVVRWENTHQLLQDKPDLYVGIKTGVTNTAGPCLASCLEAKGRRFIIVVLNCKSMKARLRDTENLRKWLFSKESIKYHERTAEKEVVQEEGPA